MNEGNIKGSEYSAPKPVQSPREGTTNNQGAVELRPLLNSIILRVLSDKRDKKVRLNYEISGGLPQVRGYSPDLNLAFTSILCRVMEEMPGGGLLMISASYYASDGLPARVEVRIENRVILFPGEFKKETVKPSFMAENPSWDKDEDLAVARNALARAGGSLAIEDSSDFGLSFLATLQAYTEREPISDKPRPR